MTDDSDILDLTDAIPCAADSAGGVELDAKPSSPDVPLTLGEAAFRYIGKGLTGPEFAAYAQSYNFGSVPPDQLIIHNTYIPDASWAPVSANQSTWWDRNESGLTISQIYAKRQQQLDAVMRYYRDTYGWDRGPHLFIDNIWIWLFTPMYDIGIHAKEGNSYRDGRGHLHYSLGIETVGHFATHGWPSGMQQLLRVAVQALRRRLQTFEIVYKSAPHHHPELHQGSIAFHNDYNKAACPGGYITPAYAIPILSSEVSAPAPVLKHYRVKKAVTVGATIRAAPNRAAAPLGRLRAGEAFEGEIVKGGYVTLPGFAPGDLWVEGPRGAVWLNLLEEVKERS